MLGTAERALLERLEDERLLERIFRVRGHVPVGAALEALAPRAAGLLATLRATGAGREAIERARRGDLLSLDALLDAPLEGDAPPRFLHHLALFYGSAAESAWQHAPEQEKLAKLELRALDAWALLLSERRYLEQLAERIAGPTLPAAELGASVAAAALERLGALARRARAGALEQSSEGRVALWLLKRVADHGFPRGTSPEVAQRIVGESERGERLAVDAALAALESRFAQAEAAPDGHAEERAVLADAARLYTWSMGDWYVALFALERAAPTCWTLYKARSWDTLRLVGETLRTVVDDAARRVARDPSALPYASLVAQMLVFRAEMGGPLATRIADVEHALALCDTHRNARVILADLLAERASDTLDGTGVLGRDAALLAARRDLERAEKLWAGLPRVASVQKRLDRMSGVTR